MSSVLRQRDAITLDEIFAKCARNSTGCLIWQRNQTRQGYGLIRRDGKQRMVTRWIMHLIHGFDLDSHLSVLHHCDTPSCCEPSHLFVGTNRDNCNDKVRKGRQLKGEQISRIRPDDVIEIFRLYKSGLSFATIARQFNYTRNGILKIIRRESWKHLAIPEELLCE